MVEESKSQDPGNGQEGDCADDLSPWIGIKLGSSNTVAAIYINNDYEVLQNDDGLELTPTVVSFEDGGVEPLVG